MRLSFPVLSREPRIIFHPKPFKKTKFLLPEYSSNRKMRIRTLMQKMCDLDDDFFLIFEQFDNVIDQKSSLQR